MADDREAPVDLERADKYSFVAQSIIVQPGQVYKVPVVVQTTGRALIKYEVKCKAYDCELSIVQQFVKAKGGGAADASAGEAATAAAAVFPARTPPASIEREVVLAGPSRLATAEGSLEVSAAPPDTDGGDAEAAPPSSILLEFRLSNAFSWTRPKSISYRIDAYVPRPCLSFSREVALLAAANEALAICADRRAKLAAAHSELCARAEAIAAQLAELAAAQATLERALDEVEAEDAAVAEEEATLLTASDGHLVTAALLLFARSAPSFLPPSDLLALCLSAGAMYDIFGPGLAALKGLPSSSSSHSAGAPATPSRGGRRALPTTGAATVRKYVAPSAAGGGPAGSSPAALRGASEEEDGEGDGGSRAGEGSEFSGSEDGALDDGDVTEADSGSEGGGGGA